MFCLRLSGGEQPNYGNASGGGNAVMAQQKVVDVVSAGSARIS